MFLDNFLGKLKAGRLTIINNIRIRTPSGLHLHAEEVMELIRYFPERQYILPPLVVNSQQNAQSSHRQLFMTGLLLANKKRKEGYNL